MKKFILICFGITLTQTACDLQPRVVSFPDTVGDFISARYPALLADPNTNPEIYNSAATDYGVYESSDLYGTESDEDNVVYASADDYTMPAQSDVTDAESMYGSEPVLVSEKTQEFVAVANTPDVSEDVIIVERGDTLYSLAKKHNTSVDELAQANNLTQPYQLSVGQKLVLSDAEAVVPVPEDAPDVLVVNKPVSAVRATTRVELSDITVQPGDTLYSLSRKYAVPVNDLAVMNKLTPPFNLSVGQKLRVPQMEKVAETEKITKTVSATPVNKSETAVAQAKTVQTAKKISSDPSKKLPKITERSSSKFSWPVRGKILSAYGAKSNGLFNDGINISVKQGTAVKAAENGVVAYAGNEVKGMGNLIIIQHSGGWMTVYAHMDSMNVKRGTRVNVGQKIGVVGKTGKVDSPQLHFEIRKGTKAYNPNAYLK